MLIVFAARPSSNKFEIGDYAVSLTTPHNELSQPRERQQVYRVLDVKNCKCGGQSINISSVKPQQSTVKCGCDRVMVNDGKHWTSSLYFQKVSETAVMNTKDLAVENEDYEKAAYLRDLLWPKTQQEEQ